MTIFAIIMDVILIMGAIGISISCGEDGEVKTGIIAFLISIIVIGIIIGAEFWYFNNTASGARAIKTQQSNLNNGIERIVKVYDINGQLIQQYEGKFDVSYDENRIIFDDENGKRHTIYYSTGTVIIDEK